MLFYLGVLLIPLALAFWECLHIFEEWFQQWSLILMIFCSLSLPWLTWQHKLLSPRPTLILLSPNFPAIHSVSFVAAPLGCLPEPCPWSSPLFSWTLKQFIFTGPHLIFLLLLKLTYLAFSLCCTVFPMLGWTFPPLLDENLLYYLNCCYMYYR